MKKFLLRTSFFLILFCISSETLTRFVIAVPDRIASIRDDKFEFDRYAPETYGKTFRFGAGKLGQISNEICINNHGWHADQNYRLKYERDSSVPLIAIIGDSYIENRYCHSSTHLAKRLGNLLGGSYDVYAFGRDGANLLQLVEMTKYVSENFDPDLIVYFAREGSISRSIREITPINQVIQFQMTGSQPIIRSGVPSQTRNYQRWLMENISTLRYLRANFSLAIRNPMQINTSLEKSNPKIDGKYLGWLNSASNLVVEKLKNLNHERQCMVIFDADRLFIYGESSERHREEATVLLRSCKDFDIPFLDLTNFFQSEFAVSGKKYEFSSNYHWNEHGNATASRGLHTYLQEMHFLKASELSQ